MSTNDISPEIGFIGAVVDRVAEPGAGRSGSVAARNRLVSHLIDPAAPGMNLEAPNCPVPIPADASLLADLCLTGSYAAFATGDREDGCRKLWAAVAFVLSLVADKRGWPCQTEDDHFNLLERLQSETGKYEDPDIVSGYLVACSYRDNAEYGFMEDYAVKRRLPVVRDFVRELLSLA